MGNAAYKCTRMRPLWKQKWDTSTYWAGLSPSFYDSSIAVNKITSNKVSNHKTLTGLSHGCLAPPKIPQVEGALPLTCTKKNPGISLGNKQTLMGQDFQIFHLGG